MKPIFIALLAFCSATVFSAVPQQINYQGFLTDPSGAPLDTVVSMTFKMYTASTSGTQLWTETQPSCTVRAGLFNVSLGSVTAVPDSFHLAQVWLGVTVGSNNEMVPRTRFVSVPYAYRVKSVDGAGGGTIYDILNIWYGLNVGFSNSTPSPYSIVVGSNNKAYGTHSSITGGRFNRAYGDYSIVCGGGSDSAPDSNSAVGRNSFVGGGAQNTAGGNYSAVVGGLHNRASNYYSIASGGLWNEASAYYAAVGGGVVNVASDTASTIGGGYYNEAGGAYSFVGGGRYNRARGEYSTVSGGGGPTDADSNTALGAYSTISGGYRNTAVGEESVIGGGSGNFANATQAVIGGGFSNYVSGVCAVVSGGDENSADGYYSTVSGGFDNHANGRSSMVPGGESCFAEGNYSFAAGRQAYAMGTGQFVWADGTSNLFVIPADSINSFNARASGGYNFYTNAAASVGAKLPASATAWVAISDSTKKTDIQSVDTKSILDRVAQLPIKEWRYKEQPNPTIRHIGPMAQDFWKAFHLGEDSLGISTIDPDGIALAAIQELAKQVNELREENHLLRMQIQTLLAKDQQGNLIREK